MALGKTEQWSSRAGFLMAAVGFSVGLGNIWRFPYVTGENGGGAFLLVYLACAFGIGLPLLIGELVIGRRGRGSPAGSMRAVAAEAGASRRWGFVGSLAVFCIFAIMTYYTVITGWTLDYLLQAARGAFGGISGDDSETIFSDLVGNPWRLLLWHTLVNLVIVLVLRKGVQAGIERAVGILMPALFVCLIVVVAYAAVAGDMARTMNFLLAPDFDKLTPRTVMVAVGQAFFSIGIGMASLITFGAYLDKKTSVRGSAGIIISVDTGVALLAGFAIFPLVFAYGLAPSGGPGLIFQTLPVAFGQMPGGQLFGSLFFLLLVAAAMTSCIGGIESVVAWIDEHWDIDRKRGSVYAGMAVWLIGLFSILSLNAWSDVYPLDAIPAFAGKNLFDTIDFLAANILLLVGGTLTALFLGWVVPKRIKLAEMGVADGAFFAFWRTILRYVAPPLLLVVLIMGIGE